MDPKKGVHLAELPIDVKVATLGPFTAERERMFETLTKECWTEGNSNLAVVHLSKSSKPKVKKAERHNLKRLTYRQRKQSGLYNLSKRSLKYHQVVVMHYLWKDYINDLLDFEKIREHGLISDANPKTIEAISLKLYRADYHGCIMSVTRSECPNYVGLKGIVVMETKNCFKLLDTDDILRNVPKATCEFSFDIDEFSFMLYGRNFLVRPGDRSSKKLKTIRIFE